MAAWATDLRPAPRIRSTPHADHPFGRAAQTPPWRQLAAQIGGYLRAGGDQRQSQSVSAIEPDVTPDRRFGATCQRLGLPPELTARGKAPAPTGCSQRAAGSLSANHRKLGVGAADLEDVTARPYI
jgi:hypothetical protein